VQVAIFLVQHEWRKYFALNAWSFEYLKLLSSSHAEKLVVGAKFKSRHLTFEVKVGDHYHLHHGDE
jgi:hypothetical protein